MLRLAPPSFFNTNVPVASFLFIPKSSTAPLAYSFFWSKFMKASVGTCGVILNFSPSTELPPRFSRILYRYSRGNVFTSISAEMSISADSSPAARSCGMATVAITLSLRVALMREIEKFSVSFGMSTLPVFLTFTLNATLNLPFSSASWFSGMLLVTEDTFISVFWSISALAAEKLSMYTLLPTIPMRLPSGCCGIFTCTKVDAFSVGTVTVIIVPALSLPPSSVMV